MSGMSDTKAGLRPKPPVTKPTRPTWERKRKLTEEEYATSATLIDYVWAPPEAAKEEAAVVILEEEDDLPELDVEMEPLDEP